MELQIIQHDTATIGELKDKHFLFSSTDELLDLMGTAYFNGVDTIVLNKHNLPEAFFDLKTKFAGEVLQKFSTYGLRLAIIGNFTNINSKSLQDFIRESNKGNRVFFIESKKELNNKLTLQKPI